MATLAAPIVKGPVITTSPTVRVDGVLDGADVEVMADDGTQHAFGTATANGTVWLIVTEPLREGTSLVAVQSRGSDVSGKSVHGTPVLPPPADLPAPTFACILNQCSDAALLSGLVPGAQVTVRIGSAVLAVQGVSRPREWVSFSSGLDVGDRLEASQSLPGSGTGPKGFSEPVTHVDIEQELDPPQIVGPLAACQMEINLAGVVPTARVTMEHEDGTTSTWRAPDTTFRGGLSRRLVEGGVRVWQRLPNCEIDSDETRTAVGPEVAPPSPRPLWYCPESQRIAVEGLVAGATVEFSTASWDNAIGGWGPETPLMIAGAAGGTQEFDLPQVVGGGAGPVVHVHVRQTLCTLTSPAGIAREYPRAGEGFVDYPPPRPQIRGPIYSCVQTVRVEPSGWGLGVLRSTATGRQLADTFSPRLTLPVTLPLWFPLAAGDEVVVQYVGCNSPPDTDVVLVTAVPNPLPDLKIAAPLPGDTDLVVSGALLGASVVSVLDQRIWAMRTATDGTARLPLPRALRERDRIWAYQRLCGSQGNPENSIEVRRGTLSVSVSPAGTTVGTPTTATVTAKRTDTGEEVGGLPVTLDGVAVGVTGSAFAVNPTSASTLNGVVVGGPRFADAAFTITAVDAPPPAQGTTLTLQLGGIGGFGSPIVVNKVTWRVQPSWGAAAVQAIGATASVALPAPSGSNPRAEVYLEEFEGIRYDAGIPFQLHQNVLAPMVIVALTSNTMHVGFLLTTEVWPVYDEDGEIEEYRWVAIIRWAGTT
jgi:hypothetical protein